MNTLGLGLLISTYSQTQQQAMMSTFMIFFPMMLLSGFAFPVANMPEAVQWLTRINPICYFLVIVRAIFLKGVGADILWRQMAPLFAMGIVRSLGGRAAIPQNAVAGRLAQVRQHGLILGKSCHI